MNNNNKKMDIY